MKEDVIWGEREEMRPEERREGSEERERQREESVGGNTSSYVCKGCAAKSRSPQPVVRMPRQSSQDETAVQQNPLGKAAVKTFCPNALSSHNS